MLEFVVKVNYIRRRTAGEQLAKPANPCERKSDLDLNTEQFSNSQIHSHTNYSDEFCIYKHDYNMSNKVDSI